MRAHRFLALVVLCVAVAVATVGAQARNTEMPKTCTKFGSVVVCTTLNTATFTFSTKTKTTASVSTSVDTSYALTALDLSTKAAHRISIPEAPATKYNFRVTVTPAKGKPITTKGSFTTGAIASTPASLTTRGHKLLLDGVPFTPIMVYGYECATIEYANSAIGLGADVLQEAESSTPCDSATLHAALNGQIWWFSNDAATQSQLNDLPELLQGTVPFYSAIDAGSLLGCKSTSDLGLYNVVKSHSATPVISSIVVSTHLDQNHANCLNAAASHALFWATIVAGGDGVEYYAHGSKADEFSVQPDIPAQAIRDRDQLATLEPAVAAGAPIGVQVDSQSPVRITGWKYGGATYVIAINTQKVATSVGFVIPGFRGTSSAQVLWEGRGKKSKNGEFSDSFAPLAVHFYKLLPPAPVKRK